MIDRPARGFTLVTALIFMVALLLIGISAMNVNIMQERIGGSSKDSNLAFQAAEAALRDAEADVAVNVTPGAAFDSVCTSGLCIPASMWTPAQSTPVWQSINWSDPNVTRSYGAYTGASALPSVAAQPAYIVEKLSAVGAPIGESVGMGIRPVTIGEAYRITVYATGARPETHVTLQSIYTKR